MSELPSISFEPFIIVIEPHGPIAGSPFPYLEQALERARGIAQTGITVSSINQGTENFLSGAQLRAVLGNTRTEFVNFPR
jgi:hypothetical protein